MDNSIQLKQRITKILDQNLNGVKLAIELIHKELNKNLILDCFIDALNNDNFRNGNMNPLDIIFIPIYDSPYFEVNINIFPANISTDKASTIIHHHGCFSLNSKNIFGSGYKQIVFNNDFADELSSSFLLCEHSQDNVFNLEQFQYHVVFGCKSLTATIAIWHCESKDIDYKERVSFFIRNNKLLKVTDKEFSNMVPQPWFENYNIERRIKIICHFIMAYCNPSADEIINVLSKFNDVHFWNKYFNESIPIPCEVTYLSSIGFNFSIRDLLKLFNKKKYLFWRTF